MIFDIEPKNSKLQSMEEVEMDDAVETTKNSNRLKKIFKNRMKDGECEHESSEEEAMEKDDDSKASKLSDFIEVIVRLKK